MNRKMEIAIEKQILKVTAIALIAGGYHITVDNCAEEGDADLVLIESQDIDAIMKAIYTTDEERLYVSKKQGDIAKSRADGWLKFIWGNCEDCLSDYTTNLEKFVKPIYNMIEGHPDQLFANPKGDDALKALTLLAPFLSDALSQIGQLVVQDFQSLNEGMMLAERLVKFPERKKRRSH